MPGRAQALPMDTHPESRDVQYDTAAPKSHYDLHATFIRKPEFSPAVIATLMREQGDFPAFVRHLMTVPKGFGGLMDATISATARISDLYPTGTDCTDNQGITSAVTAAWNDAFSEHLPRLSVSLTASESKTKVDCSVKFPTANNTATVIFFPCTRELVALLPSPNTGPGDFEAVSRGVIRGIEQDVTRDFTSKLINTHDEIEDTIRVKMNALLEIAFPGEAVEMGKIRSVAA